MNRIKIITALAVIISLPSHALMGLSSDSVKLDKDTVSSLASSLSSEVANQESSPLIDSLTSQLNVSPEQATGGAGALLALASNSLSSTESSELSSLIPGMDTLTDAAGLMSMASDMSAVTDIFAKLGLDPTMISEYAPVVLQYLTDEGASSGLLGSLSSLWK